MTPHAFAEKWRAIDLPERAAAQMHFLDLCALLGQPGPGSADETSAWFNRAGTSASSPFQTL